MNPLRHPAMLAALMLAGLAASVPAQATKPYLSQHLPNQQQPFRRATVEMLFVLDTTGSMGGMARARRAKSGAS